VLVDGAVAAVWSAAAEGVVVDEVALCEELADWSVEVAGAAEAELPGAVAGCEYEGVLLELLAVELLSAGAAGVTPAD